MVRHIFTNNGKQGIETSNQIFDNDGNTWFKNGNMLMNPATGETKFVWPQYGNEKQGIVTDQKGNVDSYFKL